jgi:DNA helicase-2/ATP-dependent DNA helicase PcrA
MTFEWTEKELNPEQSNAVLHPGSVFLIACPGSGKTRTLTYKIAYELSKLTSHREFVLAITYTNRAANEIQERIEDMGVESGQLWISTIHSFCLEWIIKPYAIYLPDLAHGYSIIDLHDREVLLEHLCKPYKSQKVTFYDCDYYFTPTGYELCCSDASKYIYIHSVLIEREFKFEVQQKINRNGWEDAVASELPDLQVKVARDDIHTPIPRRTIPDLHSKKSGT